VKVISRLRYIDLQLGLQRFERGKFLFVAQLAIKSYRHAGAVNGFGKIKQVNFKYGLIAAAHRRPDAHIGHARVSAISQLQAHRKHALQGGAVTAQVNIGGGHTQLAPQLLAVGYTTTDAIGATQQLFRRTELALLQQATNTCAADSFAMQQESAGVADTETPLLPCI